MVLPILHVLRFQDLKRAHTATTEIGRVNGAQQKQRRGGKGWGGAVRIPEIRVSTVAMRKRALPPRVAAEEGGLPLKRCPRPSSRRACTSSWSKLVPAAAEGGPAAAGKGDGTTTAAARAGGGRVSGAARGASSRVRRWRGPPRGRLGGVRRRSYQPRRRPSDFKRQMTDDTPPLPL